MDPWPVVVAMLLGAFPVPVTSWPAESVHVYAAAPDNEPDIALEPEAPAACEDPLDAVVSQHLATAGACTVRRVAAALGQSKSSIGRALVRLRDRGQVVRDEDGWTRVA